MSGDRPGAIERRPSASDPMKLIVQIPCFNEAETLPQTVADIPREIPGVDEIELLIVDDGSSDDTVAVAERIGIDHIIRHKSNKGLAQTFRTGIEACLKRGADIIVNTDGDNQYPGTYIPQLIAPIIAGEADIVVGDRRPHENPHFSWFKRKLQKVGSYVVRSLSGTDVPDTVSGFRAISREAAIGINIMSPFSYTIEMLIQAGRSKIAIRSIEIPTNAPTRESRLFKSVPDFIRHSLVTIVRVYTMYHSLRVFFWIGSILCLLGVVPILRFLYFVLVGESDGHIQSIILGTSLTILGCMSLLFGMVADLISFNRKLIEVALRKVTEIEMEVERLRAGQAVSDKKAGDKP